MSYSREDIVNRIVNMSKEEFEKLLKSHYNNEGTFAFANEIVERVNYCNNAKDVRNNSEALARDTIFSYLGANDLSLKLIHLGIVFADRERYQDLNAYLKGDASLIAYEMKTTEETVSCKQALDSFLKMQTSDKTYQKIK